MPLHPRSALALALLATLACACPSKTNGPGGGGGGGSSSVIGKTFPLADAALRSRLIYGVVGPNIKVRPSQVVAVAPGARIKAGRNEFESFQVLLSAKSGNIPGLSLALSKPLTGPGGATIPPANVTLFRETYYTVKVASNNEGGAGPWPDPLIPDVDVFYGEKRRAFPIIAREKQSRMVWVDVLVPMNAKPGDYRGELVVLAGTRKAGSIPIALHVGNFTLPSTASLASAFNMDYAQPCKAHTGTDSCDKNWSEKAAYRMRELYVRSALDHRFTIFTLAFQPPFGASQKIFLEHMGGFLDGTGKTRLKGAKVTTVRLDGNNKLAQWLAFAKRYNFYDPVDEPGEQHEWDKFKAAAERLHKIDPKARVLMTASIGDSEKHGVAGVIDVFVPVINEVEPHPSDEKGGPKNRLPLYKKWMAKKSNRALWGYQSCMSHGCGACGQPSTNKSDHGWPNRVIDSKAVQNRAFPWVAFLNDIKAELYFEVAEQLSTAWNPNGQCKFSGSGDGTMYYPGKPEIIGGKSHIPVSSIRIKLTREGMEDYEYLVLAAKKDRAKALAIARELFPHAYECDQPPAKLEAARDKLFALLDK